MPTRIARKPYRQPILSIYGAFSNLTAGGSGSVVEAGMQMAMMRRA